MSAVPSTSSGARVRDAELDIRPLTDALGAEIFGVDLARPLSPALRARIRGAFNEYGVIFFRDQPLSAKEFMDFTRNVGELAPSTAMPPVEGHAPLHVITKEEPDQDWVIGGHWHTDQSFRAAPVMGTILIAREVPDSGGDTLFVNMALAFEKLSPGLKQTLRGLRAFHQLPTKQQQVFKAGSIYEGTREEATHPVVIRHPENGREVLFVNPHYTRHIEGWTREESMAFLAPIYDHALRPEFSCRFRWKKDSIALWDNRQTWHLAINDYGAKTRIMHRLMIQGEVPVAA
jgi:taurine dioxygenase